MKQTLRKAASGALLALASAQYLLAQNVTFEGGLNQARSILKGGANSFILVVQIIIGLGGVAFIAINLFKSWKGESRTSNEDLLKIGTGLLIAIILLQIVKALFIN